MLSDSGDKEYSDEIYQKIESLSPGKNCQNCLVWSFRFTLNKGRDDSECSDEWH